MSHVFAERAAAGTYLLLDSLAAAGWSIAIVAALKGIRATASLGATEVEAEGAHLADVVIVLCAAAQRQQGRDESRRGIVA